MQVWGRKCWVFFFWAAFSTHFLKQIKRNAICQSRGNPLQHDIVPFSLKKPLKICWLAKVTGRLMPILVDFMGAASRVPVVCISGESFRWACLLPSFPFAHLLASRLRVGSLQSPATIFYFPGATPPNYSSLSPGRQSVESKRGPSPQCHRKSHFSKTKTFNFCIGRLPLFSPCPHSRPFSPIAK